MRPDTPVQSYADPISPPTTVEIVGVPLAVIDYERTLDWMDAMVAERRARLRVRLQRAHRDGLPGGPELRAALESSSLNVPDGQPLVWALNALGHSLSRPGLRPRADGPRLRARRRRDRPALLPLRRTRSGRAGDSSG